ncbi:MAG: alpha/beta hydrolase [Gammaproteobacteria bacterium]|nr:alpha/beta hydrolase [Gammaproteobacteria bacterium]MCP5139386.1 alpha/beta hydrolase [Chromatiales bacterium]
MIWLKRVLLGLAGLLFAGWLALVVYAYWPTGITEVPARSLADPDDKFVSVDGLELRYHTWGEPGPGKPAAVLLHGFGNSLQSFRLLAPLLTTHYYVVAVDMPGYGLSAKPADFDYRNPHQAQMIKNFIRALGLKNVVIGGHSLGGAIAFRVALDNPDVIGLVVMNPGIISTGVPPIARYIFFPMQRIQAKLFGDPEFRANFLRRSFIDPSIVTDEVVRNLSLTSRSEGYMSGMTSLMGQYSDADEVPMLPQLEVPSLIVWGAQDRGKPAGEFEQLRALLPNNTAVLVAGSGHYVQEEAPAETAEAMNAFVQRVMPATP